MWVCRTGERGHPRRPRRLRYGGQEKLLPSTSGVVQSRGRKRVRAAHRLAHNRLPEHRPETKPASLSRLLTPDHPGLLDQLDELAPIARGVLAQAGIGEFLDGGEGGVAL